MLLVEHDNFTYENVKLFLLEEAVSRLIDFLKKFMFWLQFAVPASSGPGCAWEGVSQGWLPPALSPGAGQQKAKDTPLYSFACLLPVNLSHWKSLWWGLSCVR